jgi:hypothetical protein
MRRGLKASQVRSDFGQQDFRCAATNARNGVQSIDLVVSWAKALGNFVTQSVDDLVQEVDVR